MKIYNPTLEMVEAKYDGVSYLIGPGKMIDVTEQTGLWILPACTMYGLVRVDFTPSPDFNVKAFIAKKAIEGIKNFIAHNMHILDQCIILDNDIKAQNQHGTVLNNRYVKEIMAKIKSYQGLVAQLSEKYGLTIEADEMLEKQLSLESSIETAVMEFEADNDAKIKMNKAQAEVDQYLKEALGDLTFN